MIWEWLESRLTPAPALAKKYNLVYHSVALKHRYKRCHRAWLPHLENCRALINEAVLKLPRHDHLVILGSAHLHEIPKNLLEKTFKRVTLVDLVHPLAVRRWARRFAHIELVEMDVTGFLARMENFDDAEELLKAVQEAPAPFHFTADLIVSSNLMSQLHLIALEFLAKKKMRAGEDFNDRLGQAFSEKHLNALALCEGAVLIYGDRETIYRDPAGKQTYRGQFKISTVPFRFVKKWTWPIAPLGEFSRRESIEMIVEAYCRI
jgi:hypothetical protein